MISHFLHSTNVFLNKCSPKLHYKPLISDLGHTWQSLTNEIT